MSEPLFLRVAAHLLPQSTAWRLTFATTLRRYWQGLSHAPQGVRDFLDAVWLEMFPASTTELDRWEKQFGLSPASNEAARRLQIAAAWGAQGGQSPSYLQSVVRAAGFDVYLHEWWQPGVTPWTPRDPRDYTLQPDIGSVQCGMKYAQCTSNETPPPDPLPSDVVSVTELYPQCNRFLTNDIGYLVNDNLTRNAPPAVPDDPATWPYFLYWGGQTFGEKASIPNDRREEFERLLLKICPSHTWLVLLIDYGQWLVGDDHVIGTPGLIIGRPPP